MYHQIANDEIIPECQGATTPTSFPAINLVIDGRNASQEVPLYYTRNQPSISFPVDPNDGKLRTLIMHDFDGQYQHFTVFNIGRDAAPGLKLAVIDYPVRRLLARLPLDPARGHTRLVKYAFPFG